MCRFQDIQQDAFEAVPGRGICTRSVGGRLNRLNASDMFIAPLIKTLGGVSYELGSNEGQLEAIQR